MSTPEEWCSDKLSKLLHEELRISTLEEIKDHFSSLSQNEASATANIFQLPLVFDCLNDTDTNQVDLACEVLSLCMNNLSLGESTSRYYAQLERALKHPYSEVKLMALKEFERYTSNEEFISILCRHVSLIYSVIRCIGDENLSVAKRSSNLIVQLGVTSLGIKQIMKPESVQVFQEVMAINETVRLRIFEVVINTSAQSQDSQMGFVTVGLFKPILSDIRSNDVLLKLNIIELLSILAITNHGYNYLISQEVLASIFNYFNPDADLLDAQLCEPGILKFFGHIAFWRPIEIFSKFPLAVERMFNNMESDDLVLCSISMDALGHIAEKNDGKVAIEAQGKKIAKAITDIVRRIGHLPTEVKIRALECFECLFRVETNETRIEIITKKWFKLLGDNPMDLIMKYCKNPFVEIRLAGFGVLNAICGQLWGQEFIKNTPGLLEFLMDRSVEIKKECKESKFEIVSLLAKSTVFDHSTTLQLQAFVKEGPFFQQALMEVAVEGND